jgi:hypothetical protein
MSHPKYQYIAHMRFSVSTGYTTRVCSIPQDEAVHRMNLLIRGRLGQSCWCRQPRAYRVSPFPSVCAHVGVQGCPERFAFQVGLRNTQEQFNGAFAAGHDVSIRLLNAHRRFLLCRLLVRTLDVSLCNFSTWLCTKVDHFPD